jgi:hypothetical protein
MRECTIKIPIGVNLTNLSAVNGTPDEAIVKAQFNCALMNTPGRAVSSQCQRTDDTRHARETQWDPTEEVTIRNANIVNFGSVLRWYG